MKRSSRVALVALAWSAVAALVTCGNDDKPRGETRAVKQVAGPSEADRVALRAEAARVFADRCARCHGVGGAGNGIDSEALVPRPRNFQDPGWQRSVKNSYLERIIIEGGAAVGRAESMPAHPDLAARRPLVTELRRYIRNLAQ